MEAPRPPFVLKLLPSFSDFAFLVPLVFLFGRMNGLKTLLGDCDTGWHIRTGEWIVANHWVPARDIFSYSKSGDPWFAWEWLADVVFAWLNGHGGLRTVVLFSMLLLSVTFALLFHLVRRKSNVVVAIVITMLAAAASSIHYLARPHLFTFVFLVLFYFALENVREGRTHLGGIPYLAILPAVTILWTNLHGGFFVGVVTIGIYGAGELLKNVLTADSGDHAARWRKARNYFVCAGACLAASLANPYFYHLHVHILKYLRDPYNSQHIVEFLSPSFHHPTAFFFESMLVLSAGAACWHIAKGRYTEPLLMMAFAHSSLLAVRNVPLFAIASALPIAFAAQELLTRIPEWNVAGWLRQAAKRFENLAERTAETDAVGRWHLVSVFSVLLIAAVIWAPNPPKKFRAEFDPNFYPAAALATLRSDPSARIFTNDEWGDYLIWSLYPSHKVFVDGRSDFYGDDFELQFIDILNVKYDWEKTLSHFGVDTILLPPDAALAGVLKETSRWRVVYDDGIALVFRSANKPPAAGSMGKTSSIASNGGGVGRDREVTKTEARDRAITEIKSKT